MKIQQESVKNKFEQIVIQRKKCNVDLHDLEITIHKPGTMTTCCCLQLDLQSLFLRCFCPGALRLVRNLAGMSSWI